jgi:hypothetical protein
MDKIKAELTRMEKLGVISRIDEPTEWCAGMVVVPKSSGQVRSGKFSRLTDMFSFVKSMQILT